MKPARSSTTSTDRSAGTSRRSTTQLDKVEKAGPEDDLHGLLNELEKTVKEVRDGGLVGSGANGHRRALKDYLEIKNGKK